MGCCATTEDRVLDANVSFLDEKGRSVDRSRYTAGSHSTGSDRDRLPDLGLPPPRPPKPPAAAPRAAGFGSPGPRREHSPGRSFSPPRSVSRVSSGQWWKPVDTSSGMGIVAFRRLSEVRTVSDEGNLSSGEMKAEWSACSLPRRSKETLELTSTRKVGTRTTFSVFRE